MSRRTVKILCLIGSVVLLVAVCGTVLAYMFRETDSKLNQFIPARVDCEVHEMTNSEVSEKTGIKVKNTGNIAAYLRVRFVSYWVQTDENGNVQIAAKPSQMPEFQMADNWVKGSEDTYYYKSPVAPDNFTAELLASGSFIALEEENGYSQVVEVFAEAIQSEPTASAAESWAVTIDENGNIISAS